MPRWQRVSLTSCAAIAAYMLAYVGTDYAKVPHLHYYQLDHQWRMAARVPGLPSGYVGLWLWSMLAALLVGAAVYAGLGLCKRPASERSLGLGLAWTATTVLIAIGYYTWNNWP